MVRPVTTSSASPRRVGSKRKCLEGDDPIAVTSYKRKYPVSVGKSPERSQSPSKKNARFDTNLIKEATPAPPVSGRSQSPVRPIRKISNTDNDPSAQLQTELRASQDRAASPRRQSKKQSPARRKASPKRGSSGLTWTFDDINLIKGAHRNGASTAKHRQAHDEYEADAEDDALQPVAISDANMDSSPTVYLADNDVCDKVNTIRRLAIEFAETCPHFKPSQNADMLDHLLRGENEKLVRHIGCLAMSGPRGKEGWKELLADRSCRRALVFGLVGRVLKEHVFSQLYFGGSKHLIDKLKKQEEELAHLDGKRNCKSPFLKGEH